ncbi:hypothetical protein D9M72_493780 [compost metagenome]
MPSAEEVYFALTEDQEEREKIIGNLMFFNRWGRASESLKDRLLKDAPAGRRASLDATAHDSEGVRDEAETGQG